MLSRLRLRMLAVAFLTTPLLAATDFCVAGTVVNALTGEPLHRAAVTIPQTATLTDAAGAFRFCGLPAGAYYANGEKPGFTPAGLNVMVGPSREDVVLRLPPLGVVKGKVVDANGDPLENALIQLLPLSLDNGRRKAHIEAAVSTDDRGEYRLPGLAAGRYLVRAAGWQGSVANQPNASETFAPVYYGGATDLASAAPLTVDPGREVTADFSVSLETAYRIRGSLASYSALLPAKVELLGAEGGLSVAPIALNAATGAFQISNVAPGSYLLRATQGEGDQRLRAEQAVEVASTDLFDVVLPLAHAVVVKGIVRTAGVSGAVPSPPGCSVDLIPTAVSVSDEPALESMTGDEGEFEFAGVLPGRYSLRTDCANGYIASVHAGDTDLLARDELLISPGVTPPPLEAVLNTDGATVDVTPSPENDDDEAGSWLVLMPESGNPIHIKFAILRGKISISAVAPGDYQAYAWTGSPYDFEYANPAVRQAWAGHAVSVSVNARDRQSITVKLSPGESP